MYSHVSRRCCLYTPIMKQTLLAPPKTQMPKGHLCYLCTSISQPYYISFRITFSYLIRSISHWNERSFLYLQCEPRYIRKFGQHASLLINAYFVMLFSNISQPPSTLVCKCFSIRGVTIYRWHSCIPFTTTVFFINCELLIVYRCCKIYFDVIYHSCAHFFAYPSDSVFVWGDRNGFWFLLSPN